MKRNRVAVLFRRIGGLALIISFFVPWMRVSVPNHNLEFVSWYQIPTFLQNISNANVLGGSQSPTYWYDLVYLMPLLALWTTLAGTKRALAWVTWIFVVILDVAFVYGAGIEISALIQLLGIGAALNLIGVMLLLISIFVYSKPTSSESQAKE